MNVADIVSWSQRLDDLATPLTDAEWQRLRAELRQACANHPKTDALYGLAENCEHNVPDDDPDYEDDLHQWGEDELLCMAAVVDHACICQDGYCSQEATALEAQADLWHSVSLEKRRADRAAHLSREVAQAWLDSPLSFGQVQDIAAGCRTEAQLRHRVAEAVIDHTNGRNHG